MKLTEEKFLSLCKEMYNNMSTEMDSDVQDFYTYESTFDKLMTTFGSAILEESLSEKEVSERKKKKVQTRFGKIKISESHAYSSALNGYRISAYLQERMAYAGCSDVYSQSNELINKFLCIETNSMQVWRVTDTWGEQSENVVDVAAAKELVVAAQDVVYAELDGAMVLTREHQWQEVKTGRIFKQSDIVSLSERRNELKSSLYTSNLGHFQEFLNKFEPMVDVFDKLKENLVILTDGAVWIRNWAQENYPNATHILDYYHACEHLSSYLNHYLLESEVRIIHFQKWKKTLYEQGVKPIIEEIKSHSHTKKNLQVEQEKLLNYLTTNTYRMDYPKYINRGLCIGSGAIESAQRTVLQERMKRAGQRWSEERVQNLLNLKVAFLSQKWDNVIKINTLYKKAA
jgi:hypothetical protein